MIRKRVRSGFRGRWAALAALVPAGALLAVMVTSGPANADQIGVGHIYGYNGMCLDLKGNIDVPGRPIDLYTCNGTGAQDWIQNDGNGGGNNLIQLGEDPRMCVDLFTAANYNGAPIVLWPCSGTDAAESWQPRPGGALFNYLTNKCLDDPNFSRAPDTNQILWQCNGGANQNYTIASF